MGYSDTSTLLVPLALRADSATAHGTNLMEQVAGQPDPLARDCLRPLACAPGESIEQDSSARHQTTWFRYEEHPERGFGTEGETRWKVLGPDPDARARFSGRIIGGCLDTLANLAGTPFGDLPGFRTRYAADGLILYLENCEMTPPHMVRALWQLAYAGWFDGLTGLVFGRTNAPDKDSAEYGYRDALEQAVGRLGLPVVYDADIGHVPPQMTIVNGAFAEVSCGDGAGRLKQTLTR
jgi:muramoyltetrapeptide carboxypeptidase LdcA involved in peptidoglycan recycling